MRPKIDTKKIVNLKTANQTLEKFYGKSGSSSREEFNKIAVANVYGELLKEKRKEKNITQLELAKKINKERTYITRIEKGDTDLQLSNFLQIINALGLKISIE